MVFPKALHSATISDVSFINVEKSSIIPSNPNPSFQSASFQSALSKNVDVQQKEESSKWTTYGYSVINVERGSITPSHYTRDMPLSSTPSLQASFINDYVMKHIVFWLLTTFFSVLSMNHSVKIDKVITNILMLFMVITFITHVEAERQITKLLANDRISSSQFGRAVSNYADTVIIGAYRDYNDDGENAGAAYIFEMDSNSNNEWTQISKLTASDGEARDGFGVAVSIYGDYAVVGAYGDTYYQGAVYVYHKQENGSWTEESKLVASDRQNSAGFGYDVCIYDKVIVVGAYGIGCVYIFKYNESNNNWTQSQKLKANGNYFGSSVAVHNNTVIINAKQEWYIFEQEEMDGFWNQTHHEIGGIESWFVELDIYENTVVIGDRDNETVYIYTKENGVWSLAQTLTANDDSTKESGFGDSVSIYDDIVVIGASFDQYGYYIFKKGQSNDSWTESAKIVVYDDGDDYFSDVAISVYDDIIVYGAFQVDSYRGAAYIIKNWDSCYSIWNETENKEILFNDTNTSYLIDYEWKLCNFVEFTEMEMTKIVANDRAISDQFGYAVSIYDETVIIAAPSAYNDDGLKAGAAYIFELSSTDNGESEWTQISELTASDGEEYDYFGRAVSIYGEFAVVAAERHGNNKGAVYVYQRQESGQWSEHSKLTASDGTDLDLFGHDVCIYDKWIAVTAYYDDNRQGSVYMFEYDERNNNWTQTQKLKANIPSSYSYFGASIALYNNTMIIGADKGWYIFEQEGMDRIWNQSRHEIGDIRHWAIDVDIYENTVIVGDREIESAYIYNDYRSEAQIVTASDSEENDYFGARVSIYDDIAVIGAYYDDDNGLNSGSIYIFKKRQSDDLWIETTKIVANDGETDDLFGFATSIDEDIIFIGAYSSDNSQGAVYTIKNWDSCYSIWNETENGDILLNETNTISYLIDYERSLCDFAETSGLFPSIDSIASNVENDDDPMLTTNDIATSY